MQRGNMRQPSPGGGGAGGGATPPPPPPPFAGFRSPAGGDNNHNNNGRFGSPTWGYRGGRSPSAGPRFGNFGGGSGGGGGGGGGSPNSSRDVGNFGPPSDGGYHPHYHGNTPSPKRWQDGGPSSRFRQQSPYQAHSPSQYRRGYQQVNVDR